MQKVPDHPNKYSEINLNTDFGHEYIAELLGNKCTFSYSVNEMAKLNDLFS